MTDEEILAMAKSKGRFNVSLRWRDIPLQKQCNALVQTKRLLKVGRIKREVVYLLPDTKWAIKNGYLNIQKESRP